MIRRSLLKVATAISAMAGVGLSYSAGEKDDKKKTLWNDNWDCRSPKFLVSPKKLEKCNQDEACVNELLKDKIPTATRHLFFVRHGQYIIHEDEPEDTDKNVLTEIGQRQAVATGERFKSLKYEFDVIVSSELIRAKQTADAIQKYIPSTVPRKYDIMLNEGSPPCMPEPPLADWARYFSREDVLEEGARMEAAFRRYCHRASPSQTKDSYELIVCHGNVIRYFICRALQFPPEGWLRMGLAHGSITHMAIRPNGRVGIRCVGEAGFMPPDLYTFS